MADPRIQVPAGGIRWAMLWLGAAGVALSWITGNEGVPVTIWWAVLAVASCGVVASLLGFGRIYNLLFIILFCAAILTLDYWIGMLIPNH